MPGGTCRVTEVILLPLERIIVLPSDCVVFVSPLAWVEMGPDDSGNDDSAELSAGPGAGIELPLALALELPSIGDEPVDS